MSMSVEQFVANQAQPLPFVDDVDLSGKVAIVTGCNSGIGLEIVRFYLQHNIKHVVAACRSEQRTGAAIAKLLAETKREPEAIRFEQVDLSSLGSVEHFAQRFLASTSKLHILNSNAGTTRLPKKLTSDGFETVAQVNHIGLSYLALLLHPALSATAKADRCITRSVITGSTGAFWVPFPEAESDRPVYEFAVKKEFEGETEMRMHYFTTALFNEMFAMEYARRIAGQDVLVVTGSPGLVETEFNMKGYDGEIVDPAFDRSHLGWYVRTPEEGARTMLQASVALRPDWAQLKGGEMAELGVKVRNFVRLDNMTPACLPEKCQDAALVQRVWQDTLDLLGRRTDKLDPLFTTA